MIDIGSILIGAGVSGAVGYVTYSYRNTIACTLTCISTEFEIGNGKTVTAHGPARAHHLTAQRLDIKNYGFRRLQDVELHVPVSKSVVFLEVGSTSSISKGAIRLEEAEMFIRINIPTLPKGEEVRINFATTSMYENEFRDIRGTGGSYRVVEGRRHKLHRELISALPWAILFIGFAFGPWLMSQLQPNQKPPNGVAPPSQQRHP